MLKCLLGLTVTYSRVIAVRDMLITCYGVFPLLTWLTRSNLGCMYAVKITPSICDKVVANTNFRRIYLFADILMSLNDILHEACKFWILLLYELCTISQTQSHIVIILYLLKYSVLYLNYEQ